MNTALITCYQALSVFPDLVLDLAEVMISTHTRDRFLRRRESFNRLVAAHTNSAREARGASIASSREARDASTNGAYEAPDASTESARQAPDVSSSAPNWRLAATVLYLSRASYGGVWRENKAGEYNVPPRADRVPPIDRANLLAAGAAFSRAELRACDFRDALALAGDGDLAYLDPPYPPGRTGAFSTYLAGGFGEPEHRALAAAARGAVYRGCRVVLSTSDCPLSRELWGSPARPGPCVTEVLELAGPRSVGARVAGAVTARELLVIMAPRGRTRSTGRKST
jgi:site-specific DNA-adenine methylase